MFERNKIDYAIFLFLFSLLECFALSASRSSKSEVVDSNYGKGEAVEMLMSTVAPFNNPQQTYDYFSLPFCRGNWNIKSSCVQICSKCKCCSCNVKSELKTNTKDRLALTTLIYGPKLVVNPSGLEMYFKVDQPKREYCNRTLTAAEADSLAHAVQHNYWYQMRIDGMPVWAFVGQKDVSGSYFVYTHKKFEIGYNGPNIVSVDVISGEKRPIEPNLSILFTYEVSWKQSEVKFDHRFPSYLDTFLLVFKEHWLLKFCSLLIIVFLMLLTIIIKKRKASWVANGKCGDKGRELDKHLDLHEPYDWDSVDDCIFAAPPCPLLFSSVIGIGISMYIFFFFLSMAIFSCLVLLPKDKEYVIHVIYSYILYGGIITGYFGEIFYNDMGGKNWLQALFGTLLFPFICFSIWLSINLAAIESQVTSAVTVEQMPTEIYISILWFTISSIPFHLCTLLSDKKDRQKTFTFTVQQKKDGLQLSGALKPMSLCDGYPGPYLIALFGGLIIFASVSADLDSIFASLWSHNVFYGYWTLLFSLCIVTIGSGCVGITATYVMIKARDYSRWCWTSFGCGASFAIYILLYSIYYYYYQSKMSGHFQTIFYFGYNFLFAIILGIYSGTLSFRASNNFCCRLNFEKTKKINSNEMKTLITNRTSDFTNN